MPAVAQTAKRTGSISKRGVIERVVIDIDTGHLNSRSVDVLDLFIILDVLKSDAREQLVEFT